MYQTETGRWRNFILSFVMSAAVLSCIMVATVAAVQPQMPKTSAQSEAQAALRPQASDSLTMVVIGTNETQAAEFLLIRFNPQYGQVPLSLLPPETIVTHKNQRMTLAQVYADGGGNAVKQALASRLGIIIERYASIPADTFIKVAQQVGSVVYTLPYDIEYKNQNGYSIQIPQGERKLDGQDIAYIFGYPGFDPETFEKSEIAGGLIAAIINQNRNIASLGASENMFKMIVNVVDTDISFSDYEFRKNSADFVANLDTTIAGNLVIEGTYLSDGSAFELSERYVAYIQQYFQTTSA